MSDQDEAERKAAELDEIRKLFPIHDPISFLINALIQIPIEQLQDEDFRAHKEAEQAFDDWLEDLSQHASELNNEQRAYISDKATKTLDHLKFLRQSLARDRDRTKEESEIEDRFNEKIDRLNEILAEEDNNEADVGAPETDQPGDSPTNEQDDRDESDDDEDEDESLPDPEPDSSPSESVPDVPTYSNPNPLDKESVVKAIFYLVVIAFLAGTICVIGIVWSSYKPNPVSAPPIKAAPPAPLPTVMEEKTELIAEFEPIVIEPIAKKKTKIPALKIGKKTYSIGDIIRDSDGCEFKIIKVAEPLRKYDIKTGINVLINAATVDKVVEFHHNPKKEYCDITEKIEQITRELSDTLSKRPKPDSRIPPLPEIEDQLPDPEEQETSP